MFFCFNAGYNLPLKQHHKSIITQNFILVKCILAKKHKFSVFYKKILLSFYKLPIEIKKILWYNTSEEREERSNENLNFKFLKKA